MTVDLTLIIAVPAVLAAVYFYARRAERRKPGTGRAGPRREELLADCEKRMADTLSRLKRPLSEMSWHQLQKAEGGGGFVAAILLLAVGCFFLFMGPTLSTEAKAVSPINRWSVGGAALIIAASALGAILAERGRRRQRLRAYFTDATDRAFLLKDMGRMGDAIAAQEETLRTLPDWDMGWFTLSRLLAEAGRHDDALAAIRRIPDEPESAFWLRAGETSIILQKGDLAVARTVADYLSDQFPDEPAPSLFSAAVRLREGKGEEALALAEKAMAIDEAGAHFWLDEDAALRDLAALLQAKGLHEPESDRDKEVE